MKQALVCDAIRTPTGRFGGALSTIRADDLAAVPIYELVARSGTDATVIDEVREPSRRRQATRRLNARLGLSMHDHDLIEINEAFAAQVIASMRELGVDPLAPHVNAHGGATAMGHPLGMSGERLVQTAVNGLHSRKGKLALVTMCVGVGQGVSIVPKRT